MDPTSTTESENQREVQWRCMKCLRPNKLVSPPPAVGPWKCQSCGEEAPAQPAGLDAEGRLQACPVCGCPDLYRQRDFNRKLGIALIVVGGAIAIGAGMLISPWLTYVLLTAFALVDFFVYQRIREVVICYHCQAILRGYPGMAEVKPFDLNTSDKYLETERRRGW